MIQQFLSSMRRIVFVFALIIVGCLANYAQTDEISALINANCDPQVLVVNDSICPWTISNAVLKGGATKANTVSILTLEYESPREQYFDFSYSVHFRNMALLIDDEIIEAVSTSDWTDWTIRRYYLEAGRHTIQFKDSLYNNYTSTSYYTQLRNISIREFDHLDITLSRAGMLGTEVLYKVDVLEDVVRLKIHGPLNDTDWEKIHMMKNLRDIDLTDADITAIPNSVFATCPYLERALLPEGLVSIGSSTFQNARLTTVDIPAKVTTIGSRAFYGAKSLVSVNLPPNTSLTTIGSEAFSYCSKLQSFVLPNSITKLDYRTFYECNALLSVVLPNALQSIGDHCFYNTQNLKSIDFPQTLTSIGSSAFYQSGLTEVILPQNLTTLGNQAFASCSSIKNIEFPITPDPYNISNSSGYYYPFYNCRSLEKVICPSATPPLCYNGNPCSGIELSKVTLVVPSFAVVDYKLDTNWHLFGNITGGAEPTQFRIASTLSLTNDRRPTNKVDMTMTVPGRLVVSGNATLEIGKLKFNTNYNHTSISAQLLNMSPSVSVDQVQSSFYAQSGRWYFITPMHDVNVNDISHSVADASFVFRYYNSQNRASNGPTGSWQNLLDNTLKAGQGYILQTNSAGWLSLPATATGKASVLVTGDVSIALSTYNATNNADANWNYVGNPYPCYYDTYYMDLTAPITVRDYDNNTYRAYSPIDDGYVLKPMEAFFVQKPANLSQILFQQEGRQLTTEVQHTARAPKAGNDSRQLFDVDITDGIHSDRTRIVMNQHASIAYEPAVDVSKFISLEADVPQIYTIDDEGNQLAINERPLADGIIPLGLFVSQPGTFTISLSQGNAALLLTDKENGQVTDLSQVDYTFTLSEPTTLDKRFTLSMPAATDVHSVTIPHRQTGQYYDLQGRKLNGKLQKGIYVKNGKKQIVK